MWVRSTVNNFEMTFGDVFWWFANLAEKTGVANCEQANFPVPSPVRALLAALGFLTFDLYLFFLL